jgi:hypothetical protein
MYLYMICVCVCVCVCVYMWHQAHSLKSKYGKRSLNVNSQQHK